VIHSKKLNFKFKGDRKYVHGTDIFNYLLEEFSTIENIHNYSNLNLSIKKQIYNQCTLHIYKDLEDSFINKIKDASATLSLNLNSTKIYSYIEQTNEPIGNNYVYNEEEIINSTKIHIDSTFLIENNKFTNIENIVAMNKVLVSSKFKSEHQKWFFSKLELNKPIINLENNKFRIHLIKILAGKHAKSSIFYENNLIGNIFFSLV
jgi:hypothetical protein